jgi:hypothetical protein
MNLPGKRLLLGSAVAVAALGAGGIAYAATSEPAPDTGYVTIEDGATTPSPGNGSNSGPQGNGSNSGPQGNGSEGSGTPDNGTAGRNGADCPEKNGSGQGQGQQTQPQTQPSQPQPQPSQPEQTQPDQAENA